MIKTPLSTVIGGAFWTPKATILGGTSKTFDQLIKSLFANNEQGFAYDPNDLSTMFQDAAGTVPVTGVGQAVGLVLDKSKGLKRSSNFNTNGTWTAGAEWTINGEIATISGTGLYTNLDKTFTTSPVTKIGDILKISINVLSITGALQVRLSGGDIAYITKAGVNNLFLKSGGNYGLVRFQGGNGVAATISLPSLVIEEVTGNHAYQSTSSARPILQNAPRRIDFDNVDDKLITTLPAQLTGCTMVRSVPNVGTQILTGQTIPTPYNDNTDHCGLIVINRALTPSETSAIAAEFNKRAGV